MDYLSNLPSELKDIIFSIAYNQYCYQQVLNQINNNIYHFDYFHDNIQHSYIMWGNECENTFGQYCLDLDSDSHSHSHKFYVVN